MQRNNLPTSQQVYMKQIFTFLFLLGAVAAHTQHKAHIGIVAGAGGRNWDSEHQLNANQYAYAVGVDMGWQVWRPLYLVGRSEYQYRSYDLGAGVFARKNTLLHQLGLGLRWGAVYGSVAASYSDNLDGKVSAIEESNIGCFWVYSSDYFHPENFSAWGVVATLGILRPLSPRAKAIFEMQYQEERTTFGSFTIDVFSVPSFRLGVQYALKK
jgi:hypothetical protein